MKRIHASFFMVFAAVFFLSACSRSAAADLNGTKWNLILLQADGKVVDLSPASQVTLEIGEKGTITGSAGCNSYFGKMDFASTDKVIVSDVGSTEMYCMKGMEVETAYLAVLKQGGRWSLEGNSETLTVTASGGQSLITFAKVD